MSSVVIGRTERPACRGFGEVVGRLDARLPWEEKLERERRMWGRARPGWALKSARAARARRASCSATAAAVCAGFVCGLRALATPSTSTH